MVTCVVVIPARMASTRFPGKPLIALSGKPMVQWVVEAARASGVSDRVLVATPDSEIVAACRQFGAESVLTSERHPSGTDRIAEVAESVNADVFVNVQGDEPLVPPEDIAACAAPLMSESSVLAASLYGTCAEHEWDDPSVVKVVCDHNDDALYFSRCPVPYARNPRPQPVRKHIGLYAYRREVLARFVTWTPGPLESSESLEQLRLLENGVKIRMSRGKGSAVAVDTPEQARQVQEILSQTGA